MTKLTGLALMAAVAFAITPAFAAEKEKDACCATNGACAKSYEKLKLSGEQKTKMDAAMAKCKAAGCTAESAAAFMKTAEGILSKEQMAGFKLECAKHEHEKKT